jgi:flavodoxin
MKVLVMYESMFGNSERVARAVGEGLGEMAETFVRDVTASHPGDVPVGIDLLVVGGPTHAFSMSRPGTREDAIRQGAEQGLASRGLREWLGGLDQDLHGLPAASFDTRVSRVRRLPGSAARSAARVLRRHGARMLVLPESFYVDDVAGPLGPDEVDRARSWGRSLARAVLREGKSATAS